MLPYSVLLAAAWGLWEAHAPHRIALLNRISACCSRAMLDTTMIPGLAGNLNFSLGCCRYTKPEPMIRMMTKIKQVFDPNGIMNPYKMLPNHPDLVSAQHVGVHRST